MFVNNIALTQNVKTGLISSSLADTWVGKDGLGRELPTSPKLSIRPNRFVGILYFRKTERLTMNHEEYEGGSGWKKKGAVRYKIAGCEMEVEIPKMLLRLKSKTRVIDFKWTDDVDADGQGLNGLLQGDCAPNGRFNYRYINKTK